MELQGEKAWLPPSPGHLQAVLLLTPGVWGALELLLTVGGRSVQEAGTSERLSPCELQ